jgi:lipid-A-disaccharide synthase
MKYYLIAGEASGDLHASNLLKELKKLDSNLHCRCWGGDKMENEGAELIKHYRDLAFMGFVEVVANLPTILKNITFCKEDILKYQPDVILLVDYPGFNLRIAKWAKQHGFKVIYYISPQIWAWKENRVHTIKKCVDKMLVILPFEKSFYEKWNYEVEYVGHPLVEVIANFQHEVNRNNSYIQSNKPIVAILPGSRKQEIVQKLPVMLEVSKHFKAYDFIVAKAPGMDDFFYQEILKDYPEVKSISGKTYDLLSVASAALVTSGTATLETALFGVPEIICYKGSKISYWIAKKLVKIKYIGLVNLIMGKEVVKELIQDEFNATNTVRELRSLLEDKNKESQVKNDYEELKALLSKEGNASQRAALSIFSFLQEEEKSLQQ